MNEGQRISPPPRLTGDMLLARLALRPAGVHHLTDHHAIPRAVEAGHVHLDRHGVAHLTAAGWRAVGAGHQTRVWHTAVAEHCIRQGPLTAHQIRRLILEQASTEQAYRRLVARGHAAAAAALLSEATLIKARLATISVIAVHRMDEEAVLLHAEQMAKILDRRTANTGTECAADPSNLLNPFPAAPVLPRPDRAVGETLTALLVS